MSAYMSLTTHCNKKHVYHLSGSTRILIYWKLLRCCWLFHRALICDYLKQICYMVKIIYEGGGTFIALAVSHLAGTTYKNELYPVHVWQMAPVHRYIRIDNGQYIAKKFQNASGVPPPPPPNIMSQHGRPCTDDVLPYLVNSDAR